MGEVIPITKRSKNFSLRVIKAFGWLKKQNQECRIISKQLLRSATGIGAYIWEAESGQSKKDRISKLEISRKECMETQYWITLLIESNLVDKNRFQPLLNEAIEIGKILTASVKTLKNS